MRPSIASLSAMVGAAVVSLALPSSGDAQDRSFLGFRENEQRRYVMGPAEALNDDEYATWSIRLLEIQDDGGRFALSHERRDPASPSVLPRLQRDKVYEDPEYESSTGEVFLNLTGFPVWARFHGRQRFRDRVADYSAEYVFSIDEYLWDLRSIFGEVSDDVPMPDGVEVDPEFPAGLFLYYGGDMICLGRGSTLQWLSDAYGVSERCPLANLLFANPGLLAAALHRRFPADGEQRDMWFLTPVATRYEKAPLLERGYPRQVREEEHYSHFRIEALGARELTLGDRAVMTNMLYFTEVARTAFVGADGRVLRVDLGLHPVSQTPRWIELVESGGERSR